ncbi:MAG: ABC transporter ATP-binding protein, partial [Turicibacter sp.]
LIVDSMVNSNFSNSLFILIGLVFLIQVINSVAYSFFLTYYVPKAEYKIKTGVKQELYEHVSRLDLNYYEDTENYNQYTLALKEVDGRVTYLMQTIGGLLNSLFYLSSLAVIILTLNPILLIIAAVSTLISFICNKRLSKMRFNYQMEINPLERKEQYVSRVFYEAQYAKEVRFFRLFNLVGPLFKKNAQVMQATIQNHTLKIATLDFIMNFLKGPSLQAIIMIYLIYSIYIGQSTIGDFTALLLATLQLGNQLYGMTYHINQFNEHSLYIENLRKILLVKPSIEGNEVENPIKGEQIKGGISLQTVSFKYDEKSPKIIDDVTLTIQAGEKVGIVGHNGAGKTTLIKLLTRLYDANDGEILLDGQPYKNYCVDDIRNSIGVVFQDIQYYPQSIAENLLLRAVESVEDEDSIWRALEKVNLAEKVKNLPKGIHTSISKEFDEEGIMLSGGELQKLAIARIYLNDYKILILDEPSSALDPFAEYEISKQMLESAKDKTLIMISHKLSLTKDLDKIYVLDNGKLIEEGSHEELMKLKGTYAKMFNLQLENYTN